MRDIVKAITPDGLCGYDSRGQLWLWRPDGEGRFSGTPIRDPRGQKCRICQQGWVATSESMHDQSYWRDYDETVHMSCEVRFHGMVERDMWMRALCDAPMIFDGLKEIPNEYWAQTEWLKDRPWYRVTPLYTNRPLTLGKRKHVYELRIEPGTGPYDAGLARELFAKEDVTKQIGADGLHIHAHNRDKVHEYLKAFAKILDREKVVKEAREREEAAR